MTSMNDIAQHRAKTVAIRHEDEERWIEYIQHLPNSIATGLDEAVLLYVTEGVGKGRMVPVEGRTANATVWRNGEHRVQGVVVNDLVLPGDMVWAPGRGSFTVGSVNDESRTITARGSAEPVHIWFRSYRHNIEGDNPLRLRCGDQVLVEWSPVQDDIGEVVTVETIVMSKPLYDVSIHPLARVIIVSRDNGGVPLYTEGAILQNMRAAEGASESFKRWLVGRTGVATGHRVHGMNASAVNSDLRYPGAVGPHPVVSALIVGHTDSATHNYQSALGGAKEEEEEEEDSQKAPESDDAIDWKAMYEQVKTELDGLWSALNQEAESRGWCSEYDDFARDNGGPGRARTVSVEVEMVSTISATEADVILRAHLSSTNANIDVIEEVEVKHRLSFDMEMTGDIEEDEVKEAAERHVTNVLGFKYDDLDVTDYSY